VSLPAWRLDDAFRRVAARAQPMVFPSAPRQQVAALEREWWRNIVRSTFLAADSTLRLPDFDGLFEQLFSTFGGRDCWQLRRGARAALEALRHRGLLLGLASNFDHRLPNLVQELEIKDFFQSITVPSSCGAAKPAAAFFEAALAALGLPPEAVGYVGHDPRLDLAAARAAGLHAIDVRPFESLQEIAAAVDAIEADESPATLRNRRP
jgi:putative hydrolase of the HAD superfamily